MSVRPRAVTAVGQAQPGRGGALPGDFRGFGLRRQLGGAAVVVVGLPLLTALLVGHRATLPLATPVLLVLLLVVIASVLGGLRIGLPAAAVGALVLNWFFTPPYNTLVVGSAGLLTVLAAYLAVACTVSVIVGVAARRAAEAARARAEAQALTALAGAALAEQQTLPGVLRHIAGVFGMRSVELREPSGAGWRTAESVSLNDEEHADEVELQVPSGAGAVLVVRGPELFAADRRVLTAFADAAATALEGRRLARLAEAGVEIEAIDRMRTALLAAVGHDLRTPLAGVKAAVSSLRQDDVVWTRAEREELLATIEDGADRLDRVVANLLDASRLEAGVVTAVVTAVGLDEVVARAVLGVSDASRVHVEVADDLPDVLADAGLAERVLVNLLENALRYSPAGMMVTVRGSAPRQRIEGRRVVVCDVIDHGPGVPAADWPTVFRPFHRLSDRSPAGVGLGLTVARGLADAMGATVTPSHTVGGGLTMRVVMTAAGERA